MRYFKCLNDGYEKYTKNHIYLENILSYSRTVLDYSKIYPKDWTEVSEAEYFIQENQSIKTESYEIF